MPSPQRRAEVQSNLEGEADLILGNINTWGACLAHEALRNWGEDALEYALAEGWIASQESVNGEVLVVAKYGYARLGYAFVYKKLSDARVVQCLAVRAVLKKMTLEGFGTFEARTPSLLTARRGKELVFVIVKFRAASAKTIRDALELVRDEILERKATVRVYRDKVGNLQVRSTLPAVLGLTMAFEHGPWHHLKPSP